MSEEEKITFKGGKIPLPPEPEPEEEEQEEQQTPDEDIFKELNEEHNENVTTKERIPLTEEEKEKRHLLIYKILRYRASFQKYINHLNGAIEDCVDMNLTDLQFLHDDIKRNIESRMTTENAKTMFISFVSILEKATCKFTPIKAEGLSTAISSSEDILDIAEELSIKYTSSTSIPPEVRLIMCMGKLIGELHTVNKMKEEAQQVQQQPKQKPDNNEVLKRRLEEVEE